MKATSEISVSISQILFFITDVIILCAFLPYTHMRTAKQQQSANNWC